MNAVDLLFPLAWALGHLLSILDFLLTLAFVSFILRSKRPPGSTLAWLMFVLLIPYVGIPCYLFLSTRKFRGRARKKAPLYRTAAGGAARGQTGIANMFASLGLPPARSGQRAALVADGKQAFEAIFDLAGRARTSIALTTFIFADDPVGRAVLALLVKKAREGVRVRVLLDSMGSLWVRSPSFRELESAGGRVAFFNPMFHMPWRGRANLRNHRKILLADGAGALVGGMNIAKEYMGPHADPRRWIDLVLLCEGLAARDVGDVFEGDWGFATGADAAAGRGQRPAHRRGDATLQIIGSGPDVAGDPLYDALLTSIYAAKKRVWIATPYFIPDESLAYALELSGKRGVDVRILVPRRSNHLIADLARGSYLQQLSRSGCKIAFTDKMMHAKAIILDTHQGLVGSANFDMRSLLFNYEIGVLLRSGRALSGLHSWFETLFAASEAVVPAPGAFKDIVEGLGRVVGPLI